MNHPRESLTVNDSTKGITAFCSAKSPIDLSSFEPYQSSVSSECPSLFALKQSGKLNLSNSVSSSALEKYVPSNIFPSTSSHSPLKTTPSRSSMFCTNLYLSSSSSSEAHRHLGNFPFLPNPSTPRPTPPTHLEKGGFLLDDDQDGLFEERQSEDSIRDFFSYHGSVSDGGFDDLTCESDSLALAEQMELQLLSDELNLAMTDIGESPGINEIYEASPVVCPPELPSEQNGSKTGPPSINVLSGRNTPETSAALKPRMRWTSELHECFLEAVKKLDGPEKATPKGVLKLMNVEGITIYHVKSHLQKYRLAKYMPEKKEAEKKASGSEEKRAHSSSKESDALKKGTITEALRMQMEVQKQLHEQLEVQRTLQLRIEEHARYLQKIFEEQQKAGISLVSTQSSSSITTEQPDPQPTLPLGPESPAKHSESKSGSSSPMPSKHRADGNVDVDEQPCRKRARIDSEAKSESPSDVCDDGC